MNRRFGADTLALLDTSSTVRIETVDRHAPSAPPRSTIVWIVVEDGDVFVRSVRGFRGRWYQDLLSDPRALLLPDHGRWDPIAVTAELADDAESIGRCSRAIERSYPGDPAVALMLRDDTLPTTVRLVPVDVDSQRPVAGKQRKKGGGLSGETLGGMLAGFDQAVFRTTPPPHELVLKGSPVRGLSGEGGADGDVDDRLIITLPGDSSVEEPEQD